MHPDVLEIAVLRPGNIALSAPEPVIWSAWQCVFIANFRLSPSSRTMCASLSVWDHATNVKVFSYNFALLDPWKGFGHLLYDWVHDECLMGSFVLQ